MWLSEQIRASGGSQAPGAEVGQVSLEGASIAVVTQGERRSLSMALPGGLRWRPGLGQKVLVLTSAEGEAIVVGALPDDDDNLKAGELELQGPDCSIRLGSRGEMILTGRNICLSGSVDIVGSLAVNGEDYKPCTCSGGVV